MAKHNCNLPYGLQPRARVRFWVLDLKEDREGSIEGEKNRSKFGERERNGLLRMAVQ